MDWQSVKTIDELKGLGTFKEVKIAVKQAIESTSFPPGLKFQCTPSGWQKLWDVIVAYKQFGQSSSNSPSPYFKSEAHRLIYALVRLDGNYRMDELGLTRNHYSDAKAASKWHRDIARTIQPDKCDHPDAERAFQKLETLYSNVRG